MKITSGNCEEVADHPLTELSSVNDIVPLATESMSPLKFISSEYTTEDVQSKVIKHNSLAYVAGFLLKRTFERHQCSTCKSYLTDNHLDDKRKLFLVFKAYDTDKNLFGGLTVPSKTMMDFLIKLEDIFVRYFRNLRKVKSIGSEILEIMEKEILNIQCVQFDKRYMVMLFIRLRIYYCIKFGNRELASTTRKSRKYLKVVHL